MAFIPWLNKILLTVLSHEYCFDARSQQRFYDWKNCPGNRARHGFGRWWARRSKKRGGSMPFQSRIFRFSGESAAAAAVDAWSRDRGITRRGQLHRPNDVNGSNDRCRASRQKLRTETCTHSRPLDKSLVIYDYRHRRYTVIRSYSRFICYPAKGTIGQ